ncbi:phage major capsid protein [Rhodanobacter sp. AS-Z3]|uniref:phage major capsid protein n=1 Tax=Rhodanobacter sp. AS-Z3 TaxID=3031330 RepID=UPI00247A6206|nr:phage major capsid protein [Rhodanobacter sp. AS-Z3]WEN13694.1 phage major capsid protein [Rhodanobacter sp. AS-Z3]
MTTPAALQPGSKGERLLRIGSERAVVDEAARTVTLAFASETPVDRYWGVEVLDTQARSMRLDRLKSGGALLMDHDPRDQVGVIESVQIGADKVARAVVRFGKSVRANEVFQDVVDGIRQNVSVGYQIHDAKLESETDGVGTYRVMDWEPYEISMVAVPADTKAGIGRSTESIPFKNISETRMTPEEIAAAEAVKAAQRDAVLNATAAAERSGAEAERKRSTDITGMADQLKAYDVRELASEALRSGWSADQFRAKALELVATKPLPTANIGLTTGEVRNYSFTRALAALANPQDARAQEAARFEFEASSAAADKQNRSVKGLLIPHDVLQHNQRADNMVVGTASAGGNLVATNLLTGSFIDLLRNAMVINRMGARYLTGLVGNIAIPKQTGGATFAFVSESGTGSPSGQTIGQVPMTPKTGMARTQLSRKLLLQSSLDVESFIRNDLATIVGLGIQQAAINGSGSAPIPMGILNQSGIGSVVGGTNGLAPTWGNIVGLESAVAIANADVGSLGYLTNAGVRGKLKTTQKFPTSNGDAIWADGNTPLNGYQVGVTNAVPSNGTKGTSTGNCSSIIFGNFADLIVGMWGGLELQVDPYSQGDSGSVVIRAFQDVDVAVRHPESFAAMIDALTA